MSETPVTPAGTPTPPTAPRKRSLLRTLLIVFGVLGLVGITCAGSCIGWIWYSVTRPSYGPESVAAAAFTLAPRVHVELLPSHYRLRDSTFSDFDVTPEGAVVVIRYGDVLDLASGERLGPKRDIVKNAVRHVRFISGGMAVCLDPPQGPDVSGLAYLKDDQFADVPLRGVQLTGLYTNQARDRLYLVDDRKLYSLEAGKAPVAECQTPYDITAVTGDDVGCIFATGGGIFRLLSPGEPLLVLKMPDRQPIEGLASTGQTLYFSTRDAVYVIRDDMAVPLAIGLGGKLQLRADGLYVLDATRGRVFRLTLST